MGITDGNLKPQNLLLDPSNNLKVSFDLGLSTTTRSPTTTLAFPPAARAAEEQSPPHRLGRKSVNDRKIRSVL